MSRLSEITQAQREQLRKNAIKAMMSGVAFIKYDNALFMMNTTNVTDNDFMAVIDRAEAVWNCSRNNTIEELVRVNLMDEGIPPRPEGHDDKEKWDTWKTGKNAGKPKDPLWLQYELPLVTEDERRIIIFKASTKLAREAVGRLLDKVNSNEKLRRPFVTLTVAPNPDNIYQMLPDFTITGYSDDLDDVALPGDKARPKPTNGSAPRSAPSRNSDMDDDIPFE